MTLYEGSVGKEYTVQVLLVEDDISRRLQALGLIEGTTVKLLNRKREGSLIIYVRGTRLALGRHITSGIKVKEAMVELKDGRAEGSEL